MTKTNKIINGVDVSECVYAILPEKQCPAKSMPYAKETSCVACKEHNTKHNFCKNNPNCNFKRFKRKDQECEELKREIAFGNNGKLSDKIRAIVFKDLNDENSKYKQALDEIRNIIKSLENENILTFPDLSLQENAKAIMGQCNSGYEDILNIINKAEDGE